MGFTDLHQILSTLTRKELISAGVLSLEDDIKCSALVLSKHPRSAETFTHRYQISNINNLLLITLLGQSHIHCQANC